jgi:hypothetical protein
LAANPYAILVKTQILALDVFPHKRESLLEDIATALNIILKNRIKMFAEVLNKK